MDVFAEVIENGERTGLIAYREELWKKKEGMDRRLVLRLFGDKLNWRATMDLMLARSLQLTIGARGLPVSAYSINTGEQLHNVYLERSANKWPLMPENYSFFVLDKHKPGILPACAGTSSTSAAISPSTTRPATGSAGSTARCSRSAASGAAAS